MVARIEERVMLLETPAFANIGRPGLVAGTRELVEWPYIVVYQAYEERDEIVIISIFHGAQDRSERET
jgi:plasmid stabilization system protein ParE